MSRFFQQAKGLPVRCDFRRDGVRCEGRLGHSDPHILRGTKFTPEPRAEPIEAWRYWSLSRSFEAGEYMLSSVSRPVLWTEPVMTTRLGPDGEPMKVTSGNPVGRTTPLTESDPGVFSYKTPNLLRKHHSICPVAGRIECYGHVVEHEWGYRAQKVRVKELWLIYDDSFPRERTWVTEKEAKRFQPSLIKRYGVYVHPLDLKNVEAWAKYYSPKEEWPSLEEERKAWQG